MTGIAMVTMELTVPSLSLSGEAIAPHFSHRSYGVLLWEIVTYGDLPLEQLETQDVVRAVQEKKLTHTL